MHLGQRVPFRGHAFLGDVSGLVFTPKVWLPCCSASCDSPTSCISCLQQPRRGGVRKSSGVRLMRFGGRWAAIWFLLVYIIGAVVAEHNTVCGCVTAILPFTGCSSCRTPHDDLLPEAALRRASARFSCFRGPRYDSQPEFDDIVDQFKETTSNNTEAVSQLRQTREQSVLRRLPFLIFLVVLLQFNGKVSIPRTLCHLRHPTLE
ncbi:putative facilitated trehalose transporter Tret1-2-like 9 [Homarus americanus]|uniref:Putative facilitated trehalose transporter Tret1-2-like 9 n=1 Tax=Homarus americanus TaxID=6706 RepID=A0A8J5K0V6_HOMAM|nr:putative facilitated trehalose transporter Tret1-2-like 9 [Homarus americanus]